MSPAHASPEDIAVTPEQFHAQIATLTAQISAQLAGRPLDALLDEWLNLHHGAGSPTYLALKAACEAGVAAGWLCQREGGGIKYGRIFKPDAALQGFSVDVVDMADIAGPHHTHPQGEIDLVMPQPQPDGSEAATFDGRPAGWVVYPPGSAHRPTVRQGRALVLYLLPQGQIEFTK
jgi:hypothetical protein